MIASFLITLREVIEASLIVATILGILAKSNQKNGVRTVWIATILAALTSVTLLIIGSMLGLRVQEIYSGKIEAFIEGTLMSVSALFVTWAVFFLHTYFATYKTRLLVKLNHTALQNEQKGLFLLTFTAVFREGFEIVLFLSTIFFSSNPVAILTGFAGGATAGLLIAAGLFAATLKLPVRYAFRTTSILLIFFAAGLFARGIHEFAEIGVFPELSHITLAFIPATGVTESFVQAIFGLTRTMGVIQISAYIIYIAFMTWWIYIRKPRNPIPAVAEYP